MLVNKRQGSQKEPAAGKIHWLFEVNSPPTVLWKEKKETPKSQNLMMSVHNFFPGPLSNLHFQHSQVVPLVQFFSFSAYSKALATYLKPH